jgi:hypothetical protein
MTRSRIRKPSTAASESGSAARWKSPHPPPAVNSAAPTAAVGTRTRTASTSTMRMPRLFVQRGARPTAQARRGARNSHPAMAAKTRAKLHMRIKNSLLMGVDRFNTFRSWSRGLPGYRLSAPENLAWGLTKRRGRPVMQPRRMPGSGAGSGSVQPTHSTETAHFRLYSPVGCSRPDGTGFRAAPGRLGVLSHKARRVGSPPVAGLAAPC